LLAAGTDGTDGPTEDAGAIVDPGTIGRAELAGIDVERAMRDFDSGTALEAAEDLLYTGPTGTNVGDILIGMKSPATSVRDAARGRML
jgi:hydroxypyruvate reductase